MKNFIFLLSFIISVLASLTSFAQQNLSLEIPQETLQFSEAELAQMLAPIALYPDSILTHILIASTYPIEIVEAHRWLVKNKELNSNQLAKSVEDFNWDASVKALVPFERILSRLSEDLTWTQQLGDAFLHDEEKLLESIQALRKQAEHAGNLEKMENMEVSYEDDNIVIAPVEKEIVYVPYYDTRMVYGAWHWSSYPPVFWTPRHNIYVSHYSPFYWHSGIHISFNYFFSAFHWHNRHVVVVNSHNSHRRYYHQRPRRLIANGGYAKRWSHKPAHRKGVAYRSKRTSQKYQSKRARDHQSHKLLHSTEQNKNKRNFKQRLAAKSHSSSNRQAKVTAPLKSKLHTPQKSRAYVSRDKPKVAKVKPKELKQKSEIQQDVSSKKVMPKRQTKNRAKHNVTPVRKKQNSSKRKENNSNRRQKQQHK